MFALILLVAGTFDAFSSEAAARAAVALALLEPAAVTPTPIKPPPAAPVKPTLTVYSFAGCGPCDRFHEDEEAGKFREYRVIYKPAVGFPGYPVFEVGRHRTAGYLNVETLRAWLKSHR